MKALLLSCLSLFCIATASSQYCDFQFKDSLFVTVQQDTIYVWDMLACAQCAARFSDSVSVTVDTIFVVQTDTAGAIAMCDCLFNLRSSITGIPHGTYWIVVYRDYLKKYGYPSDSRTYIGALQCQYEPTTSPTFSHRSYQSACLSGAAVEEATPLPTEFSLVQIYPNPFNPSATVQFRTSRTEFVEIKIFDILGREVQTLLADRVTPGTHNLTFTMTGNATSGTYFCRMVTHGFSQTKAIILLR